MVLDWFTVEAITAYREDLTHIRAFISGPVDSPYEGAPNLTLLNLVVGGLFELEISILNNYPLQERKYKFLTVIYHP
jgi:ubiquitin-protein ligase